MVKEHWQAFPFKFKIPNLTFWNKSLFFWQNVIFYSMFIFKIERRNEKWERQKFLKLFFRSQRGKFFSTLLSFSKLDSFIRTNKPLSSKLKIHWITNFSAKLRYCVWFSFFSWLNSSWYVTERRAFLFSSLYCSAYWQLVLLKPAHPRANLFLGPYYWKTKGIQHKPLVERQFYLAWIFWLSKLLAVDQDPKETFSG